MPVIYAPAIENLHSLLILAWCEYGGGREQGEYTNLCVSFSAIADDNPILGLVLNTAVCPCP